jgi:hypothetical protein
LYLQERDIEEGLCIDGRPIFEYLKEKDINMSNWIDSAQCRDFINQVKKGLLGSLHEFVMKLSGSISHGVS